MNCAKQLGVVKGQFLPDYYASHFHYLQFGYWKSNSIPANVSMGFNFNTDRTLVQQTRKACEAVGSYLLFFPEDESMLHNKGFYQANFPVTEDDFKPRRVTFYNYKKTWEQPIATYL